MLRLCEHIIQRFFVIAILIGLPGLASAQSGSPEPANADSLWRHLTILGDDSLRGRGTGSAGCDIAARYIADILTRYGVQPLPGQRSLFQTFPVHGSRAVEGTQLTFYAPKDSYHPRLNEDYVLYSTGDQTFLPVPVRLVFVGYGIVAPEYDYNDYQNIDVRNAVVVFLSGEPRSADRSYFDGERETIHSSVAEKQRTALARGAAGSILLPNPNDPAMEDWYEQQRHFRFEDARLLMSPASRFTILLNQKLAPLLFGGALHSFDEITAMERNGAVVSFPLELRISFQGRFAEREFLTSNIAGVIEGSDPSLRDTYVMVSAHYDHLGIGTPVNGDSIYNGVADNASGVASAMEIARSLSAHRQELRRSVLFLFITGEERGFIGSQYYCRNPLVPLHRTIADVNVDGLSLFEPVRTVIPVGGELSDLGAFVRTAAHEVDVGIDTLPAVLMRRDQFQSSDQFIFAQSGIPSILVAEGLHYRSTSYAQGLERSLRWSEERYHSPFDDLSQPIDITAMVQHTNILLRLVSDLARSESVPQWTGPSVYRSARIRSISEKR